MALHRAINGANTAVPLHTERMAINGTNTYWNKSLSIHTTYEYKILKWYGTNTHWKNRCQWNDIAINATTTHDTTTSGYRWYQHVLKRKNGTERKNGFQWYQSVLKSKSIRRGNKMVQWCLSVRAAVLELFRLRGITGQLDIRYTNVTTYLHAMVLACENGVRTCQWHGACLWERSQNVHVLYTNIKTYEHILELLSIRHTKMQLGLSIRAVSERVCLWERSQNVGHVRHTNTYWNRYQLGGGTKCRIGACLLQQPCLSVRAAVLVCQNGLAELLNCSIVPSEGYCWLVWFVLSRIIFISGTLQHQWTRKGCNRDWYAGKKLNVRRYIAVRWNTTSGWTESSC